MLQPIQNKFQSRWSHFALNNLPMLQIVCSTWWRLLHADLPLGQIHFAEIPDTLMKVAKWTPFEKWAVSCMFTSTRSVVSRHCGEFLWLFYGFQSTSLGARGQQRPQNRPRRQNTQQKSLRWTGITVPSNHSFDFHAQTTAAAYYL